MVINLGCYWLALFTAFPEHVRGPEASHYFLIQFPVGILGALFDSFSFFVTVWIVRKALQSRESLGYIAHLCLDLVIAVLATFWVVGVFSVAGWLISQFESQPETLVERTAKYQQWVGDAVKHPSDSLKQIYFTLVMGISASLPSCVHLYAFLAAFTRYRDTKSAQQGRPVDPVRRLGRRAIALSCVAIALSVRNCNQTQRSYDIATTADYRAQAALRSLEGVERRPQVSIKPIRLESGGFSELVHHQDQGQLRMLWEITNSGYDDARNVRVTSVLNPTGTDTQIEAELIYEFAPLVALPAQKKLLLKLRSEGLGGTGAPESATNLIRGARTTVTYDGVSQNDLSYTFTVEHTVHGDRVYESDAVP